jgi:hypothetical protein
MVQQIKSIQLGERKTMTISKRLMGLALIGFLATACSSTTVKGSWVKPDYTGKIECLYYCHSQR